MIPIVYTSMTEQLLAATPLPRDLVSAVIGYYDVKSETHQIVHASRHATGLMQAINRVKYLEEFTELDLSGMAFIDDPLFDYLLETLKNKKITLIDVRGTALTEES